MGVLNGKLRFPDAESNDLVTYIAKVTAVALSTAIVVQVAVLYVSTHLFGLTEPIRLSRGHEVSDWILMTVVTPLLESLVLYPFCVLALNSFPRRALGAAAVIGVVAGAWHAVAAPLWFFAPAASFFIWSFAWIKWRARGKAGGFFILLVPHMVQNSIAMLLMTSRQ